MRPAPLGEGHAARIKPAVDHLRDPSHPVAGGEGGVVGDCIDVGLVHAEVVGEVGPGTLGRGKHLHACRARLGQECVIRGYGLGLAGLVADPDRQGCAPIPLAGQGPVDI